MGAPPHETYLNLIFSPMSHIQIPAHWWVGIQHMGFGVAQTFNFQQQGKF